MQTGEAGCNCWRQRGQWGTGRGMRRSGGSGRRAQDGAEGPVRQCITERTGPGMPGLVGEDLFAVGDVEDAVGPEDVLRPFWGGGVVEARDIFADGGVFRLVGEDAHGGAERDEFPEFGSDVPWEADAAVGFIDGVDPTAVEAVAGFEFDPERHGVLAVAHGALVADAGVGGVVAEGGAVFWSAEAGWGDEERLVAFHDVDGVVIDAGLDANGAWIGRAVGWGVEGAAIDIAFGDRFYRRRATREGEGGHAGEGGHGGEAEHAENGHGVVR